MIATLNGNIYWMKFYVAEGAPVSSYIYAQRAARIAFLIHPEWRMA
jgi:hypothetical protein